MRPILRRGCSSKSIKIIGKRCRKPCFENVQIKPFAGLREDLGFHPMAIFYRAVLLLRKPLCFYDRITVVGVSLTILGCFLVLFAAVTSQHNVSQNAFLSSIYLWVIAIGVALYLFEELCLSLRVERIAVKRAQRSVIRES